VTTPISIEHLRSKLEAMKAEMDSGRMRHGEYDQRLARLIQELRDRRVDADRPALSAALDELLERKVITPAVKEHLTKRLGLS